ncbi:MAG: sigma-G inhibitor, Gin [Peptococcaceae bacterium]|nr:sigma-G inhibitor, Gin [Peptococcaceae bacterium]
MLCRRLSRDDKKGLCLRGNYICPACEARIISLTRNDPDYDIYISGLKKIWAGFSA